MGGEPYWYYVPFTEDVGSALKGLREREFAAGRYNPATPFIDFSEPSFLLQTPGSKHATIEEAREDAAEEGTRSILDIERIGLESDYGVASPVPSEALKKLYGTDKPTRAMVENLDLLEGIERGHCSYVIVYDGGAPSEILFAGYSYD